MERPDEELEPSQDAMRTWLTDFIKKLNQQAADPNRVVLYRHANILTPEQEEEMDRQYQAIGFKLVTNIRLASDITFATFEQAEANAKERGERNDAKVLVFYRVVKEGGYGWAATRNVDDAWVIAAAIQLLPARYDLVAIAIYTEGHWRREL